MRVFFIASIVLIVLFFGSLCALSYRALRRQHEFVERLPTPISQVGEQHQANGLLGELGSQCGGVKRLPCKPGLLCNAATDGVSEGSCIKDPKAPVGEMPMQFGEACGLDMPACAPGLFCREDAQRNRLMFCSKLNENAPFIVSMKAEGSAPAEGGYHAKAGITLDLVVQTTNVERVLFRARGRDLGEGKKQEGGKYELSWVLPASFDGEVQVLAFRGAEFSSVALRLRAD